MPRQPKETIPPAIRWEVLRRDNLTCHYCGAKDGTPSIDHKTPESKGGSAVADNLVTACPRCNRRKGTKSYEQFWMEITPVNLYKVNEYGTVVGYSKKCRDLTRSEAAQHLRRNPGPMAYKFHRKKHGKKLDRMLAFMDTPAEVS